MKPFELLDQTLSPDGTALKLVRRDTEYIILVDNGAPRTPNTTNITFPGIEGEALIIALDLKGLACSTGAACSSGAVEPSHVLTAIGLSAEDARASIRFSLGRHTTQQEISAALEIVPAAVAQLRELSPAYQK